MARTQTDSPFTAFGTDGPATSAINSMLASLSSQFDETRTAGAPTPVTIATPVSVASAISSGTTAAISSTSVSSTPTTLSTVPSSRSSLSSTSATSTSATIGTSSQANSSATSAAQNTPGANVGSVTAEQSCDSISCSAGLKAAVAVPVVVGVLGIIALAAFLIRRRRRKARSEAEGMGKPKPSKKWTRHLRMFSFDAELLMGGRFSSTNSLRSGRSSVREANRTSQGRQADQPSIHSVDEVAPPYRDAVSHAQSPSMVQTGPGILVAGAVADPVRRPESTSTAPPPYGSVSRQSNRPTTASSMQRNPFTDSSPPTPVDSSPFNDPAEGDGHSAHTRSTASGNSSLYHGHGEDETSTLGDSEAASIHEARVGRHVSVSSVGRAINHVRTSQHRTTPSP